MILNELKRVITSKKFIITLFIGLIIACISVYLEIKEYIFFNYDAPDIQTATAQENVKLMIEQGLNKYSVWFSSFSMFIVAMPILSALPYGLSYIEDKEYGIIKHIDLRINHNKYIISKILANGIGGGVAIIIPTVILTIVIFIIFKGNIIDFYGYGTYGGPFATLLTQNFCLYAILHIFINFIFAFAYSNIALAVSAFVKNKVAIILSPFLFWILGSLICSVIGMEHYSPSLINQFYASPFVTSQEIFIELIFIIIISSALFIFKTRKYEIYEC